ncbi:hypothetical protein EVJ58_g10060 [Rhodofomes roseus]|uniref:Uncharacterized protein n=1 Tax=Rhodofomes roseus TaxID=34475 RepID=A0A4Y9XPY2_9APHY|nr:hypothetical protein EVJ58_g10060 [Rhodofomes roseus]
MVGRNAASRRPEAEAMEQATEDAVAPAPPQPKKKVKEDMKKKGKQDTSSMVVDGEGDAGPAAKADTKPKPDKKQKKKKARQDDPKPIPESEDDAAPAARGDDTPRPDKKTKKAKKAKQAKQEDPKPVPESKDNAAPAKTAARKGKTGQKNKITSPEFVLDSADEEAKAKPVAKKRKPRTDSVQGTKEVRNADLASGDEAGPAKPKPKKASGRGKGKQATVEVPAVVLSSGEEEEAKPAAKTGKKTSKKTEDTAKPKPKPRKKKETTAKATRSTDQVKAEPAQSSAQAGSSRVTRSVARTGLDTAKEEEKKPMPMYVSMPPATQPRISREDSPKEDDEYDVLDRSELSEAEACLDVFLSCAPTASESQTWLKARTAAVSGVGWILDDPDENEFEGICWVLVDGNGDRQGVVTERYYDAWRLLTRYITYWGLLVFRLDEAIDIHHPPWYPARERPERVAPNLDVWEYLRTLTWTVNSAIAVRQEALQYVQHDPRHDTFNPIMHIWSLAIYWYPDNWTCSGNVDIRALLHRDPRAYNWPKWAHENDQTRVFGKAYVEAALNAGWDLEKIPQDLEPPTGGDEELTSALNQATNLAILTMKNAYDAMNVPLTNTQPRKKASLPSNSAAASEDERSTGSSSEESDVKSSVKSSYKASEESDADTDSDEDAEGESETGWMFEPNNQDQEEERSVLAEVQESMDRVDISMGEPADDTQPASADMPSAADDVSMEPNVGETPKAAVAEREPSSVEEGEKSPTDKETKSNVDNTRAAGERANSADPAEKQISVGFIGSGVFMSYLPSYIDI